MDNDTITILTSRAFEALTAAGDPRRARGERDRVGAEEGGGVWRHGDGRGRGMAWRDGGGRSGRVSK
jgi:hypothetical protein